MSPQTRSGPKRPWSAYPLFKRILDLVVSGVASLFLFFFFPFVALAIRLDSAGPILFKQVRLGLKGQPFSMLKFRSMMADGDESIHRAYYTSLVDGDAESRENEEGDQVFLLDDPRVTRVGRFLRRTSIDELPNFLNVFKGDMTLVGPRPPIPYEVELYDERAKGRLAVKPGMTGLAQVSGRGSLSFARITDYDLDYVARQSMLLDLVILWRTIPAVLGRRGV